ncbi:MAG: hypothetical protein WC374_05910 [Phycisphaerae bacterium]|jgi:hypothetical protein
MSENKEYIGRGALFDKVSSSYIEVYSDEDVLELISNFPAADVEPVVRGEWKEDGALTVCSVCGEHKEFPHWICCPSCGAHMERSGSGED